MIINDGAEVKRFLPVLEALTAAITAEIGDSTG
jgi:hypothetical protein